MSSSTGSSSANNNSSSPSSTPSKSKTASKIIKLAGLTGGNGKLSGNSSFGSGTYPSFRFSPESEEIQEVLSSSMSALASGSGGTDKVADTENESHDAVATQQSESLPSSPKPGETSPIKEYFRKNWGNKFDKKSLSLDLDFRGKIKTVIEDKRKSIVSHFIAEEAGIVPPAATIQEHTGISITETICASSQSQSSNNGAISTEKFESSSTSTSAPENFVFSFDNSTKKVSSNMTSTSSLASLQKSESEEYEEVGIDFIARMDEENKLKELLADGNVDESYLEWTYPAFSCTERFEGVISRPNVSITSNEYSINEKLGFIHEFKKVWNEVISHTLTKYFIGLLGIAALSYPLSTFLTAFLTFLCGIIFSTVLSQILVSQQAHSPTTLIKDSSNIPVTGLSSEQKAEHKSCDDETTVTSFSLHPSFRTQSWMLEFEGHYNPHLVTFLQSDPVFVRLINSFLYISNPSKKFRIPKRKLWNHPEFNHDIKFVRHRVYDLSGAEIFIAPEKLASKRIWNKKYPIGIRLGSPSSHWYVTKVLDTNTSGNIPSPSSDVCENTGKRKNADCGTPSQRSSTAKRGSLTSIIKGNKEYRRRTSDEKTLYFFTRTCREKEDWFRRLVNATKHKSLDDESEISSGTDLQQDYLRYMSNIIPNIENCLSEGFEGADETLEKKKDKKLKASNSVESEDAKSEDGFASCRSTPDLENVLAIAQSPTFLNALLGRLLYDAVRSPFWSLQLQNMIQRKLNYVKRPTFVELLIAKDLDLGGSFPIIQRASLPVIDARGLWIDMDVTYEGNFCLTLEAKINLMKLRKSPTGEEDGNEDDISTSTNGSGIGDESLVGNLYDSDAEDSGESSEEDFDEADDFYLRTKDTDSESELSYRSHSFSSFNSSGGSSSLASGTSSGNFNTGQGGSFSKKAKILKMVEKVANSNFVYEMKVVKSAIGKVANTPILLTVEVKEASGTITVNIPPPPSNRVWIGFRSKPHMKLVTTPKVGERLVNLTPLTDWIQRKIHQQIQRVLVLPNMDDIVVKVMELKLPS